MQKKIKVDFTLNGTSMHKVNLLQSKVVLPDIDSSKNIIKISKEQFLSSKKINQPNEEEKFLESSNEEQFTDSLLDPESENEVFSNDELEEDFYRKKNQNVKLTKRQLMMQNQESIQLTALPDRKSNKKKNMIEEDPYIRQEKELKRRQKLQKQIENQKYEVVNKILNDVGRKQKQRKEKEENQLTKKPKFREHPPGTPTYKYISNHNGNSLVITKDLPIFYQS